MRLGLRTLQAVGPPVCTARRRWLPAAGSAPGSAGPAGWPCTLAQGGAKIFCALCAQIFCASRTLSRFARFLYLNFELLFLNFELLFLNFVKGFVPKNLAPPPRLNPVSAPVYEMAQHFLDFEYVTF